MAPPTTSWTFKSVMQPRALLLVGFAVWCTMAVLVLKGTWSSMGEVSVRAEHRQHDAIPGNSSRGIVICLHDGMVPMALSLVQELRHLGNKDVIHMYHCGADEISALSRATILAVDPTVQFIDVCTDMVASGKLREDQVPSFRSYWLKPLALIHSKLNHVMLMDTDVMVFHDPALLWDIQGYRDTGTLFFRDREIIIQMFLTDIVEFPDRTKQLALHALVETFDYAKFNLEYNPSSMLLNSLAWKGDAAHEQDSSITLIHKSRASVAMDVLFHLVTVDIHRHTPIFTHGDKELFWLAYELSQTPYFFSPWANSGAARPGDMVNHPNTLCGDLAQWIPDLRYQHALLYINGAYVFNPRSDHLADIPDMEGRRQKLLKYLPTHVSAQRRRSKALVRAHDPDNLWSDICLYNRGSEPIRPQDLDAMQRKINNAIDIAIQLDAVKAAQTSPAPLA
ncbi:hypothetical protein, variant [Aphanomyces invadans]|uniref:Nucleotide-diphospho-sugar transferase domain-containing protein n=1 Tax=Aphanomyces invadans TaxID=157072 RepID=A0A024TET6_9STRA|nr:hypothetical protein, variant [Aphanomyces invadans]ETV92106.1 hypothetical protein, variant [Aphanomyces invadans]|eukprot:XP_008879268.1 hypothetical protein, variant [Aphanomyces invadans]